jgi:hypothetical protein
LLFPIRFNGEPSDFSNITAELGKSCPIWTLFLGDDFPSIAALKFAANHEKMKHFSGILLYSEKK